MTLEDFKKITADQEYKDNTFLIEYKGFFHIYQPKNPVLISLDNDLGNTDLDKVKFEKINHISQMQDIWNNPDTGFDLDKELIDYCI